MGENYRFGGGSAETTLSLVVLVGMVVGVILILLLPRKRVIVPFLLLGFLVPSSQTLVLGGVHLFVVRILILAGCGRLVAAKLSGKSSAFGGGFNTIDKVFFSWALVRASSSMLLYGDSGAVINQIGFLWDSLGGYCFLRFAIHDEEEIHKAARVFAIITIIAATSMVVEQRSMTNVFGFIGGQPSPDVREGKARSQGPFSHAILAGAFGASVTPLFLWLWSFRKDRAVAAMAMVGAATMVVTSASSTSFGAFAGGIVGACFWPVRRHLRTVRWCIVLTICLLALIMKAPVWFLLARVDLVGGSSGYHRALLIDQCIHRFGDWWLVGTNNNQNWGWDMWDVQNEFVAEGLKGGLAALVLFLMLMSRSFTRLGIARKAQTSDKRRARLTWLLGAVILAHIFAFFGADYFDQTRFWWYASLAMVSAATAPLLTKPEKPAGEVVSCATGWEESSGATLSEATQH